MVRVLALIDAVKQPGQFLLMVRQRVPEDPPSGLFGRVNLRESSTKRRGCNDLASLGSPKCVRHVIQLGLRFPEALLMVEDNLHQRVGLELQAFHRGERGHVQVEHPFKVLIGQRGYRARRVRLALGFGEPLRSLAEHLLSLHFLGGERCQFIRRHSVEPCPQRRVGLAQRLPPVSRVARQQQQPYPAKRTRTLLLGIAQHLQERRPQVRVTLRIVDDDNHRLPQRTELLEPILAHPIGQEARGPPVASGAEPLDGQPRLAHASFRMNQPDRHGGTLAAPAIQFLEDRLASLLTEGDDLVARLEERGGRRILRQRPGSAHQEVIDAGDAVHIEVVTQERNQALGGGPGGELLEVVIPAGVGEVHHALHHHRIELLVSLGMGHGTEGRRLHLQAQRLAHGFRDEGPDLLILDHLAAAAHRRDMDLERKHRPLRREVGEALAVLDQECLDARAPAVREGERAVLHAARLPKVLDDLLPLGAVHVALRERGGIRDTLVQLGQHPVLLPRVGDGTFLPPGLVPKPTGEVEVLDRLLPVAAEVVRLEILLHAVGQSFARVVEEQPLRRDHIPEVRLARAPRAHAAHRHAPRLISFHQREQRVRRRFTPHVFRLGQRHPQRSAALASEGAERHPEPVGPPLLLPMAAFPGASLDLLRGLVLQWDRREDHHVGPASLHLTRRHGRKRTASVGASPLMGAHKLDREMLKTRVRMGGVQMIDVQPDELSLAAVNRYLDIKARGVL
ncbi:hypothetical protein DB31_0001 [Hyalangium minutum]|uniref:Uncharacterized protein n=1 Tax=Hyalangium minutum TaxID=394096 RepID=A0A085WVM7_9BACT|nr:hypothetical protein DB31_0001 [Hyalangium minutum]